MSTAMASHRANKKLSIELKPTIARWSRGIFAEGCGEKAGPNFAPIRFLAAHFTSYLRGELRFRIETGVRSRKSHGFRKLFCQLPQCWVLRLRMLARRDKNSRRRWAVSRGSPGLSLPVRSLRLGWAMFLRS